MPGEAHTIPELLVHRATHEPDMIALVHDDDSITYGELDRRTRRLAAAFAAERVTKAARIGILMPNGIDWTVVAYAAARIGAVVVPLSTLLRPPELVRRLRQASVTHLVAVAAYRRRSYLDELSGVDPALGEVGPRPVPHPSLPALRHLWRADRLPDGQAPAEIANALEARVRPADDLAIIYTSGSRGSPKGVIHTHGGAIRAVASSLDARCIGPGDRIYIPQPFFWIGGFAGGLMSALVAGATLLGDNRLGPVLPENKRGKPGARANLFGMTESFGPYCGSRLDSDLPESAYGSCGKPFEGIEVRILDDAGNPLGAGERGEIAVRGPNLMRGIVGRLRDETFTRDGFYRTGDLGHLDADGYMFYAGRVDDGNRQGR